MQNVSKFGNRVFITVNSDWISFEGGVPSITLNIVDEDGLSVADIDIDVTTTEDFQTVYVEASVRTI